MLFLFEPEAEYNRQRKHYLSSHALADFKRCPMLFRQKELGLIPERDSAAFSFGRAAHKLIIEGQDAFEACYAVGGPVNPKTGKIFGSETKAYAEWAQAQGKPCLTEEEFQHLLLLAGSVRFHAEAQRLLAQPGGHAEAVVRAQYAGTPCQIRMDYFSPSGGLVDLKTCDDLHYFESDVDRYGYLHQMAFYRAVLVHAHDGLIPPPVHLIAVEKQAPYRCGVWCVRKDTLEDCQRDNEVAIARLLECRANDRWPHGYEATRYI